ncbi:MAG: hypothetical protein AMXMBFR53_29910 [Gemmatimonadota bacterium]
MLGVSEAEFWRMSPQQFQERLRAFNDQERKREQRADFRAGVIAAEIFNSAPFREGGTVRQPHDYFASLPVPEITPQSGETIRNLFRSISGAPIRKAEA